MAEYYSIEPKEKTTFSLDKNLYDDLNNYSNEIGLNKSEAINNILFNFFKGKILTNTYLNNKGGLSFNIPLDLDIKKQCRENKTILNADNSSNIIGDNTALVKINKIPNNLDVFMLPDNNTAGSFQANKDGVLHCGIDWVFIPEVITKPKTINYNKFDVDLLESLYIFYFEVKADNTTDVIFINPIEAINRLSNVNNRIVGDKLTKLVQLLEVEQTQINREYIEAMEQTTKSNNYVSSKKKFEVLNTHFTMLEMDLLKNDIIINSTFKNSNISID